MSFENLVGQTFGQYELQELLGAGGMGAVYRASQRSLKRLVAVKVLSPTVAEQPGYLERFNREAEVSASLEHKHIVPVHDYGIQDNITYIVMRLLTGGSLAQRLQQVGKDGRTLPTLYETSSLLQQLASALDYAHSRGVIHRDIKPGNIMFDNLGDAYLVDFGIAKLLDAMTDLTGGAGLGTPSYMPPEQWRSEDLTPAADQYALAVAIYNMLTGQLPFDAATPFQMMHKHLNELPTPLRAHRDVPLAADLVLERALKKNPAERFPTITAFAQAFDGAIAGAPAETTGFFDFRLPGAPTDRSGATPSSRAAATPSPRTPLPTAERAAPPADPGTPLIPTGSRTAPPADPAQVPPTSGRSAPPPPITGGPPPRRSGGGRWLPIVLVLLVLAGGIALIVTQLNQPGAALTPTAPTSEATEDTSPTRQSLVVNVLPTGTATPVPSDTPTPEATATATEPASATPSDVPAASATPVSLAAVSTATSAPTDTVVPSPTDTPSPEPTDTPEPSATMTATVTPSPAPTDTAVPSPTATHTPQPSATPSHTATTPPTSTPTLTPQPTDTRAPSATPTDVPTATATPEAKPTLTPTDTPVDLPTAEIVFAVDDPFLQAAEVTFEDTFDESELSPDWEVWNEPPTLEDGAMVFYGTETWENGISRIGIDRGEGVLVLFQHSDDLLMEFNLQHGNYDDDTWRNWTFSRWDTWIASAIYGAEDANIEPYVFPHLESDTWYYLLVHVGTDGVFYTQVWERGNTDYFLADVATEPPGDGWDADGWEFAIHIYSGTLRVDRFQELSFPADYTMPDFPPALEGAPAASVARATEAVQSTEAAIERPDVLAFCNDPDGGNTPPANLTAGQSIDVYWYWSAASPELLRQHNDSAVYEVYVDGRLLDEWIQYREPEFRIVDGDYYQYWSVPFGPLPSGQHRVSFYVTWTSPISDGYGDYGPGTDTVEWASSCTFGVR